MKYRTWFGILLLTVGLFGCGHRVSYEAVPVGDELRVPVTEFIDCIADEDFHWCGYYDEDFRFMRHYPDGYKCEKAWCKTCQQFVCTAYGRH